MSKIVAEAQRPAGMDCGSGLHPCAYGSGSRPSSRTMIAQAVCVAGATRHCQRRAEGMPICGEPCQTLWSPLGIVLGVTAARR